MSEKPPSLAQRHYDRLMGAVQNIFQALVLDIDGTLKRAKQPIPESLLRKIVGHVQARGVLVLATSRTEESIDRVFFQRACGLGLALSGADQDRIFLCAENGANVYRYSEYLGDKARKILSKPLTKDPDSFKAELLSGPLKHGLDFGALQAEDVVVTRHIFEIKLAGERSRLRSDLAARLNDFIDQNGLPLKLALSPHRINGGRIEVNKKTGLRVIAEIFGFELSRMAKIGNELHAGGNDATFDDEASFSVDQSDPANPGQINVREATGNQFREAAATEWLLGQLQFERLPPSRLGEVISAESPDTRDVQAVLEPYLQRPFADRTAADREAILLRLGVPDPTAFIESEAARHRDKNHRAVTEADRQQVYDVVSTAGIDYLLDPLHMDLRISYRFKPGASRPNSNIAVPRWPKGVTDRLFKLKFQSSGLEQALARFFHLPDDAPGFLATGGEVLSFRVETYGVNCVIKLNVRHPRVADGAPRVLFVKIDSWRTINQFGGRLGNVGAPGYRREERLSINHAPFLQVVNQRYGLSLPESYAGTSPILVLANGGEEYVEVIDEFNAALAAGYRGSSHCLIRSAGESTALIDCLAVYDRVVTLKSIGDRRAPVGGQFVVNWAAGSPRFTLIDYDWVFQLDEFWRRRSVWGLKDPCRVLGELALFSQGKTLLEAPFNEENQARWRAAVTEYIHGYRSLFGKISQDIPVLFTETERAYREPVRHAVLAALHGLSAGEQVDVLNQCFIELPGTSKNIEGSLARFMRGKPCKDNPFLSESDMQAECERMREHSRQFGQNKQAFIESCRGMSIEEIASRFAKRYVRQVKAEMRKVLALGSKALIMEMLVYYFLGLSSKHPDRATLLYPFRHDALDRLSLLDPSNGPDVSAADLVRNPTPPQDCGA